LTRSHLPALFFRFDVPTLLPQPLQLLDFSSDGAGVWWQFHPRTSIARFSLSRSAMSDASMVIVTFPGVAIGYVAFKLFGLTAGIVATGVVNGAVYGFVLYAWGRLANKLANLLRTMTPSQR
jgi:hypothetical protein